MDETLIIWIRINTINRIKSRQILYPHFVHKAWIKQAKIYDEI